tara:strand:+ start:157 stop:345 length:189 start_codon:yes stop_codon:yes gene_type:complete
MTSPKAPPEKKFVRPKREASITVHLSAEEKALLDRAAFDADKATGALVRKLALDYFKNGKGK